MFSFIEEFVEPFARYFRFREGIKEINPHKNYFDKNSFIGLIPDKINYKHKYFELCLNNLFVLKK